jgi:hypothetical protein
VIARRRTGFGRFDANQCAGGADRAGSPPAKEDAMFKKNVGTMDRLVRICIGIALIAMMFFPPHIAAWGWLGLIPLLSGIAGRCPLYGLIGVDTCPLE